MMQYIKSEYMILLLANTSFTLFTLHNLFSATYFMKLYMYI